MGQYSEKDKKRTIRYIKEKIKRIEIRYQKEEYNERILPAVTNSGMKMSAFFKQAVEEKIERDGLL